MISIGALALMTACNSGTTPADTHDHHEHGDHAGHDHAHHAEAAATDEAAGAAEVATEVGDALTADLEITSVEAIAADPGSFAGKTVQVQGTPAHMCGSGCSATLEAGEAKLKIRSNKEVFKFPAEWREKAIVFEGVIEVDPGCSGHHEGEHAEGEHAEGEHAEGEAEITYVLMAKGAKLAQPAEAAEPAAEAAEPAAEAAEPAAEAAEPAAEPAPAE